MGLTMKNMDTSKVEELYNARFEKYGNDIKTVGWGSASSQKIRFEVLFRNLEPMGKTILDIGCGLGDLVPFLEERTDGDFQYIGIDIAEKLIEHATNTRENERTKFHHGDVFSLCLPEVDIAVLSGALSLEVNNIESYAYETMKRMHELVDEAACLNFLSKYVDYELDKNHHYSPEKVFTEAIKLTKRVNLFHDYPLHEFTVQLFKPG